MMDALPHAEGPEKSILSSMLQTPDTYIARAKAEGITPSTFYFKNHQKLFKLFLEKTGKGEEIEIVGLTQNLIDQGELDSIGGPSALTEIYTYAPSPAHFNSHLAKVRDCFARREALRMAEKVKEAALDGETSQDALTAMSEATDAIRIASAQKQSFKPPSQSIAEFVAAMEARASGEAPGQLTGIAEIDALGGGMRDGEFWIVCGETSAGKSALSYQMAGEAIEDGKHALIFTLEMGAEEVISRRISCAKRIPLSSIMSPNTATGDQLKRMRLAAEEIQKSSLQICDTPNMSLDFICAQAEQYAEAHDVAVVVVDYIQLITATGTKGQSREQELAGMSRRLKQLAKKINCPVISPAQVNDDGKLRDSRAIGHDADVVLKIKDDGILVNKFRNGARGSTLPLKLNGAIQRFETTY